MEAVGRASPTGPAAASSAIADAMSGMPRGVRYVVRSAVSFAQLCDMRAAGGRRVEMVSVSIPNSRSASSSRRKKICVCAGNAGINTPIFIVRS